MPLNEVGDFLSGIFGPVAFLWLVVGYFQQGVELKLNTQALELQSDELKNSVEQQREMVEVSRLQFQAEMEAMQFERRRFEKTLLPRFVSEGFGGEHRGNGYSKFSASIKNLGAAVTNVAIEFTAPMETISPEQIPFWDSNERVRIEFAFEKQCVSDCELDLAYIDGAGRPGKCTFVIHANLSQKYPELVSESARYH